MVAPPRLSPQKQQERQRRHQLAERLEAFGWIVTPPSEDLGEDFLVHIYYKGRATGVIFHLQLKSVTNLAKQQRDDYLPYPFEVKDITHWEGFASPAVLMVWDVTLRTGRWTVLQESIADLDNRHSTWRTQDTITVRIPWVNDTTDQGLHKLQQEIGQRLYPVISRNHPLMPDPNFALPETEAGQTTDVEREIADEAWRLSKLLMVRFGARSVWLFGSLAWGDVFTTETDIDLAVQGMPAENFFKALNFLEHETKFPVDLIDLDTAPEQLRQRILAEGKVLHEQVQAPAISR